MKREKERGGREREGGGETVEGKRKEKKKFQVPPHLLRQKVDRRRPEDRGELQARDDVDEVDVVAGPVGRGKRGREKKREKVLRSKKKGIELREKFLSTLFSLSALRASSFLSTQPPARRESERKREREQNANTHL